jgi:hypothetical protein
MRTGADYFVRPAEPRAAPLRGAAVLLRRRCQRRRCRGSLRVLASHRSPTAARGITFLTLRAPGRSILEALAALPSSAWTTHNLKRAGRYRHPQIYEEIVHLNGIDRPLRQLAIRNIGHAHPTLLITNDLVTAAKDLFGRYAERMIIENELDADISRFSLRALASGLPLNVDLDTCPLVGWTHAPLRLPTTVNLSPTI